ncbi:hypothetical protein AB996_1200 [Lactococcus cremoris]|uniref:Uncharacterized protein n=1 Tax=Lactococcus lactis subsp. cremoris TaxID=1359 RepID=A0A166JMJ3_LACLC|nr:hypothetical protein AB996_1200 [Lactococcus cremoris]
MVFTNLLNFIFYVPFYFQIIKEEISNMMIPAIIIMIDDL